MAYAILTADRVKPGDALPELAFEVKPIDVVLGALASRDWRPQHHDYKYATERNGVREYWLIDWRSRTLTVFRLGDGKYDLGTVSPDTDRVSSSVLSGLDFAVGDLFP